MSTKFVPLTTRPASTSRHGMTRLRCTPPRLRGGRRGLRGLGVLVDQRLAVEDRLALGDREASLEQRLADDHAGEVDEPQVAQRREVLERRDAAGVEEAAADRGGDPAHLLDVDAL